MAVKTTNLGDLPREGIRQPDPVILPDPATLFRRRAERLRVLAVAHPMADWLGFLALIADAQAAVVADGPIVDAPLAGQDDAPPLDATRTAPGPVFDHALPRFAKIADAPAVPDAVRAVLLLLAGQDAEALARDWLRGGLSGDRAGEAVFLAAALQVSFALRAAALDVASVRLLPQRGRCPVCGSAPVAGMITGAGKAPGVRYLHCGLCATAWNHVRVACIGCGESKTLALQEVEGGTGAVKAETCDACHGYAKMFYQAKDMAIEPLADDLASLGLDLMVSDAGWSRLAPNPLIAGVG